MEPLDTPVPATEPTRLRLLLLDDDDAILWPVAKYFRSLGWDVVATVDPEEAEAVLRNEPFAAVVLDLSLSRSGRDGLDVLRSLRLEHPGLPAVILSAYVSPELEADARRLGANAVLKKPLALRKLAQVLLTLSGPRS